jgi:hypothetical protein
MTSYNYRLYLWTVFLGTPCLYLTLVSQTRNSVCPCSLDTTRHDTTRTVAHLLISDLSPMLLSPADIFENADIHRVFCFQLKLPSDEQKGRLSKTSNVRTENIKARSRNHGCLEKAISIPHSQCVSVALFIQYAKRMRIIILSYMAFLALKHFSTLSHKRHNYRGKKLLNIKCVLNFSTTSVWNISQCDNNSERYCH